MNILVLGSDSQIGNSLKEIDIKKKYNFFSKKEFNINNYRLVKKKIYKFKPEVIINCAAYTNVEMAEGQERIAKSEFTIRLNGYIVPDVLQKDTNSIKKFYSKSNLEFISETITSLQDLNNQSPSIT